ncbi:MAG: ATP-binding cassette domain-containing protein [Planctomycetes bacterium]|nr:ATP-binding cassette domain-containing protein [Planctomycetota bacterium]
MGVLRKSMKVTRAQGAGTAFTTFLSRFGAAVVTLGIGYIIIFPDTLAPLGVKPLELKHVIPFMGFTALAYKAIKSGARDYANLQEFLPGSERLFAVFDTAPKILDQPDAVHLEGVTQGIVFRDVEFAYNHAPVLKGINLEVKADSVVAIVGHSGAGKSTLLDLIPRFYDPQQGSIEIDGHDVRRVTRDSLLANIAIVGQNPFLFNATIADNIRYGRKEATLDEIIEAAKAANIHDFVQSEPEGYDTIVGDQGVKLSGGQRQRLTIARAILKDAPILILDEATSSLDNESEKLVQAALQNLMKGRTTFVIAHRLSTVQHADRIVVLKDGRIMEDGTHDVLLAAGGEYARLYQSEF